MAQALTQTARINYARAEEVPPNVTGVTFVNHFVRAAVRRR